MNKCLYANYKKTDNDSKKKTILVDVPTISKSSKIKSLKDVFLSEAYPIGKKTKLIFSGIYTTNDFVSTPLGLGISKEENIVDIESFLIWLGINKFAKYIKNNTVDKNGYFKYLCDLNSINRVTSYTLLYKTIDNFEFILSKLTVVKLLIWIYYDEELRKQIDDYANVDQASYFFGHSRSISKRPSYIKHVINCKYIFSFKNLFIEERFNWVNKQNIDYANKDFSKIGLTKGRINEILFLLGAKDDFNYIPIEKVAEIINLIPKNYPKGEHSQSFYKKALSHYKFNGQALEKAVSLFADNGTELKVYSQKEIYFNDTIKLPKRLKQDFPILNFPVRAGGADAIKFFGINDLKTLKVDIISHHPIDEITKQFNEYLDKLRPLILALRINHIEENKRRKNQALICNKIKIILCSDIKYRVLNKEYGIDNNDFLHYSEETYYLKVNDSSSLNHLQNDYSFTVSIAEILSLSFDISRDKNDFNSLVRSDLSNALLYVKHYFGEDILQEARDLLGLADYKQAFWQAVFQVKGFDYSEHIDDLSLEALIEENFGFEYNLSSLEYENLIDEVQLKKVESLFKDLEIELEEFAKIYSYKISMRNVHFSLIKNTILTKKKMVKASVWQLLKEKDIESQALFMEEINKFENYEVFAEKIASENELRFSLDLENVLKQYVSSIYGEIEIVNELNVEQYKIQNLKNFNNDERNEISINERFKSLIYFENAIKILKEELNRNQFHAQKTFLPEINISQNSEINIKHLVLISSDHLKQKNVALQAKTSDPSVFTPKPKDNKILKEIGNRSEELVYHLLSNDSNCKDVYWASDDNEGLHYDIRYTDKNNVVKYVEVKTFDNSYFHITKAEYDFGNKYEDDYEIWLVNNQMNIIPIKDFFSNNKYEVVPNEFLVHLEIN
jgi:hypothetical protein